MHLLKINLNLDSSAHARTSEYGESHCWLLIVPFVYEKVYDPWNGHATGRRGKVDGELGAEIYRTKT